MLSSAVMTQQSDPARLRQALGMSVREAARLSGIARGTIENVEEGVGQPGSRRRYLEFLQATAASRGAASGSEGQNPRVMPTIFRRHNRLCARLDADQMRDVAEFEAELFRETAQWVHDPDERRELAVYTTVRYIERHYPEVIEAADGNQGETSRA
jgi:transcriptional regulator with XRE-family HTH domain